MDEFESEIIYRLKGIAVILVVFAHTAVVNAGFSATNIVAGKIIYSIGSMGVPIFFILSGYLFYKSKINNVGDFIIARIKSLLMPWILCGLIIYIYTFYNQEYSVSTCAKFLIGIGYEPNTCTPFYYLTITIILYTIFFKHKKNIRFIYILTIISLISILLTSLNKNLYNAFLPYLNPFNWICYFTIGLIIGNKSELKDVVTRIKSYYLYGGVLFFLVLLYSINIGENLAYWKWYYIPALFGFIILVAQLSSLKYFYMNFLEQIGKKSFYIYLIHSPIASGITKIKNYFDITVLTIISPFVAIFITVAVIMVVDVVIQYIKKCRKYGNFIEYCTFIRRQK